jgi:hypothetical protein
MRKTLLFVSAACLTGIGAHEGAEARTISVVAFESEYGAVLLDSLESMAAFRLFESLNVAVENHVLAETKIFAPRDGSFRIACTGRGADYGCAVMVYAGKHAKLDFDTDRVELSLPSEVAGRYKGVFDTKSDRFHFETEDKRLTIDWSRGGLHILAPGKTQKKEAPGQKI